MSFDTYSFDYLINKKNIDAVVHYVVNISGYSLQQQLNNNFVIITVMTFR